MIAWPVLYKVQKNLTKIRKSQKFQLVLSLRHVVEYHVMEQGAVETCHWSHCGHQFSRDDDIGVSISFDLEYRGVEVESFLLKYSGEGRRVTLLGSIRQLSKLKSYKKIERDTSASFPRDWAPHPNPCFHQNRWTPQPGWGRCYLRSSVDRGPWERAWRFV